NLRLFARAGEEAAGIERAVTAFPKLGQRLNQLAGTMSGGEQQMLALARAYARRADVILLDEVSMGPAPTIVDEIFEFLARLDSDVGLMPGAAGGPGRPHAVGVAEEGAGSIAVDRCADMAAVPCPRGTAAELEETARLVEALGRRVIARPADVRDHDGLAKVV